MLQVVELRSRRGELAVYLLDKVSNPVWLGIRTAVQISMFLLVLMAVADLLNILLWGAAAGF